MPPTNQTPPPWCQLSTLAVFNTAPMPVVMPQPSKSNNFIWCSFVDFATAISGNTVYSSKCRCTHVVINPVLPSLLQTCGAVRHQPFCRWRVSFGINWFLLDKQNLHLPHSGVQRNDVILHPPHSSPAPLHYHTCHLRDRVCGTLGILTAECGKHPVWHRQR